MMRALFYRGRHFATTTDGPPVLVTELESRAAREDFDRNITSPFIFYDYDDAPEQLGALSV